jgi:hypothetical protein
VWGNTAVDEGDDICIVDSGIINPTITYHTNYYEDLFISTTAPPVDIGNIVTAADPGFADPVTYDVHLLGTSSCIDAGYDSAPSLPDFDYEGQPRIIGDHVDIGADECIESGDVNGNGIVDLADVIVTLQVLGGMTTPLVFKEADLDGDARVGMEEALELLHQLIL